MLQRATGYRHTFVAGVEVVADGVSTGATPGRLIDHLRQQNADFRSVVQSCLQCEPAQREDRSDSVTHVRFAKTPEGYASGSFGPTTAGRMDAYVDRFQKAGGSFVMLAKGNRSQAVTRACQDNGGFYLGSIGGPAARLAQDCIKSQEIIEYPELGMEAVWKIEVEDFPAFIVVDDKGNDFFTDPGGTVTVPITGLRVRSAE